MTGNNRLPSLFESHEQFRQTFMQGLSHLLDSGGMNLFILVCANASLERQLFSPLKQRLAARYRSLLDTLRASLQGGAQIDEADDDLLVFLKIAAIGIEQLQLAERRCVGPWEVQFNQLRSFRPARNSQQPVDSIYMPFDPQGFHFNKPFMQQEVIWSGTLLGSSMDLYYNKYPFVESHCLLVPQREAGMPQYLTRETHDYVWRLLDRLRSCLPGVRVGYNALGAFASVNHLHFQLFVRDKPLPLELDCWMHNGGEQGYPLPCEVFDSSESSWLFIHRLHQQNEAYNLLYTPGCVYAMPRRKQGDFTLPSWANGFSWYELCGGVITFSRESFCELDAARFEAGLQQVMPDKPA